LTFAYVFLKLVTVLIFKTRNLMSNLTENRLDQVLDATTFTDLLSAVATLESLLPEGSLDDEQRTSYRAINVNNKVFTEDVLTEMQGSGSAILPPYLSSTSLSNDLQLFEQLDQVDSRLANALRKVADLKRIAGHEAYSMALSVYKIYDAANQAGIPGAKESFERLKVRFENQGKGQAEDPVG